MKPKLSLLQKPAQEKGEIGVVLLTEMHPVSYQSIGTGEHLAHSVSAPDIGKVELAERGVYHCHTHSLNGASHDLSGNKQARRTLLLTSVLCVMFMVGEVIGGSFAGSLAIMTDAAHLLTDFASFMISLFALFMASRPPSKRMSFGWHRAEVLGALISVLMIWIITGALVYVAIERIVNKSYEVDAAIMLITAGVGVAVNIIMGLILHYGGHGHSHGGGGGHGHSHGGGSGHGHSHGSGGASPATSEAAIASQPQASSQNINVRAALIHVIGDFLQSLGVFVAALVIYFQPHLAIVDPICTFLFSVLVLITTVYVLKDALNVLMEGMPSHMDFREVEKAFLEIPGVLRVHDLRIWCLTMDKVALSVHLALDEPANPHDVVVQARDLAQGHFHIYECTIQIERFSNAMDDCLKCLAPHQ